MADENAANVQNIEFSLHEQQTVAGDNVSIVLPPGTHSTGSSCVRQSTVIDYMWEKKIYDGHIVATRHNLLAYAIRLRDKGAVRVVHASRRDKRLLLETSGEVLDLAFAHCSDIDNVALLAVADNLSTVVIASISGGNDGRELKLSTVLILTGDLSPESFTVPDQLKDGGGRITLSRARVVWCPYVPDEAVMNVDTCDQGDSSESFETTRLLLVTYDQRAALLNIASLMDLYKDGCRQPLATLSESMLRLDTHPGIVTDACFSPDGSAIATACDDGVVRFFHTENPLDTETMIEPPAPLSVVHQWRPHGQKQLSFLAFLDNHQDPDPGASFWKFALTGASGNSELKLWSCKNWRCLQTVSLSRAASTDNVAHQFHITLDRLASHVLVVDVFSRQLVVLTLSSGGSAPCDGEDSEVRSFISARRLALMYPPLSVAVRLTISSSADGMCSESAVATLDSHLLSEQLRLNENGESSATNTTEISCYIIQPRSLQLSSLTLPRIVTDDKNRPADYSEKASLLVDVVKEPIIASARIEFCPHSSELVSSDPGITSVIAGGSDSGGADTSASCDDAALRDLVLQLSSVAKASSIVPDLRDVVDKRTGDELSDDSFNKKRLSDLPPPPPPSSSRHQSSFSSSSESSLDLSKSSLQPETGVNLMTPQAFFFSSDTVAPCAGDSPHEDMCDNQDAAATESSQLAANSNESSPSIEVQDILNGSAASPPPAHALPSPPSVSRVSSSLREDGTSSSTHMIATSQLTQSLVCPQISTTISDGALPVCTAGANVQAPDVYVLSLTKLTREVDVIGAQLSQLSSQIRAQQKQPQRAGVTREEVAEIVESCLQRFASKHVISDKAIKQRQENNISATPVTAVKAEVAECMKREFRELVMPTVNNSLKKLETQMQQEVNSHLAAMDTTVRETMRRNVNSKVIAESVSNLVASAVQSAVTARCREALVSTVVPAYERATTSLLQQVTSVFEEGTKHYLQQVSERVKRQHKQNQAAPSAHHVQLQSTMDGVRCSVDRVLEQLKTASYQKNGNNSDAMLVQLKQLRADMSCCLQLCQKQHQLTTAMSSGGISSGMATPQSPASLSTASNSEQVLARIKQLITEKSYNSALQIALQAADLHLLMCSCRLMRPEDVFSMSGDRQLDQPVLLALVQQLSVDLSAGEVADVDLKLRYLHEALLFVEPHHTTVREHLPAVLRPLSTRLQSFLAEHPSHKLGRNVRMLCTALLK